MTNSGSPAKAGSSSSSSSSERPSVLLRKGREISVLRRHPWIFSGAVAERRGLLSNGSLVDVFAHDGKYLATGHWGTRGISVRVLSFDPVDTEAGLIRRRITDAVSLRQSLGLLDAPDTNAFRVVHGEGDFLPGLVVDRYAETAVVQCHSAGMWRLREELGAALLGVPSLGIGQVAFRKVEGQVGDAGVPGSDERPEEAAEHENQPESQGKEELLTIVENGHRFLVDVEGGQKTGFFLDQRVNRERLKSYTKGKQVLNAFSYSGAFSVYALAGGASWVCSVDASKGALELARQNVALNFTGPSHTAEVADCFSYLETIGGAYDVIVLDPPAFAKHQKAVQRGLRGYETINALAIKGIEPGGILFTFSCSQLVSRELFRDVVLRAASHAERSVRILDQLHQSPCHPINLCHPEGDYLKGLVLLVD